MRANVLAAISRTINGTATSDTITGTAANELIRGYAGADIISAGGGDDKVYGGIGDDWIAGNPGNDLLYGQDGHDSLYGGNGNDRLEGGSGLDLLDGGAGNDILIGGGYTDWLTGGSGADRFVFTSADELFTDAWGPDVIMDFSRAEHDRIDLRHLLDQVGSGGQLTFIGNAPFSGAGNEVRFQYTGTYLGFSVDIAGYGFAGSTDFAVEVAGGETFLTAGDFLL